MNFKKGFALIEILVVVVIVGILTGIILSRLSESKVKGSDTSVKSNLGTIRSIAEIFFLDNSNSYLPIGGTTLGINICPKYDPEGTNMFSKSLTIANAISEATSNGNNSSCYNSRNNWVVAVGLRSKIGTSWCVDNQGTAKVVNSDPASAINPVTFKCN